MRNPSPLLKVRGLTRTYPFVARPRGNETAPGLHGIDLHLRVAEKVFIVGPNGSGKSTLARILSGFERPDAGEITLTLHQGRALPLTLVPMHRRAKWIATVFQNPLDNLVTDMTLLENFILATPPTTLTHWLWPKRACRNAVREKLATLNLGLEERLDTPVQYLSGGERQAATLLMSLIDPRRRILLLDEHTAALDIRMAQRIARITQALLAEYHMAALIITHHLADAIRHGDRIYVFNEGHVYRHLERGDSAWSVDALITIFSELYHEDDLIGPHIQSDDILSG